MHRLCISIAFALSVSLLANDVPSDGVNQDGAKIVFASFKSFSSEILIMNADGTGAEVLTLFAQSQQQPAFRPDGKQVAFVAWTSQVANPSTFVSDIYVIETDGRQPTNLTSNPAADRAPAFSPDGTKIAFSSKRDGEHCIYVMNADGSEVKRLTTSFSYDSNPAFSPDGKRIVFSSMRYDGSSEIYVMNADGSGQTRLTGDGINTNPTFSPDGSQIAFESDRDGNYEIYVMNADGTDQAPVTKSAASDTEPAYSPDGLQIAFVSDRDGNSEIYLMNANGSAQIRLTNNSVADRSPTFPLLPKKN